MSRLVMFAAIAAGMVGCSKPAPRQDVTAPPPGEQAKIAVPGAPSAGPGAGMTPGGPSTQPMGGGATAPAGADDAMKLKPEEGSVSIQPPASAKAGSEAVAKIVVTPGANYHVNVDFKTKVMLEQPAGVTLAKAQLEAGGPDKAKAKGDAETFEEKGVTFAVKLTPSASGNYTINGKLKFAVCTKDQCLPKEEAIAIAVAAK